MTDNEFAAAVYDLIDGQLRTNPETATIADEIRDEVKQGKFESKSLEAPKYEDDGDTYSIALGKARRSKQKVTTSRPFSDTERARLALKALRRFLVEPRALGNHLESKSKSGVGIVKGNDEDLATQAAVPHPLMSLTSSTGQLRLTLADDDARREFTLIEIGSTSNAEPLMRLEAIIANVEKRLG